MRNIGVEGPVEMLVESRVFDAVLDDETEVIGGDRHNLHAFNILVFILWVTVDGMLSVFEVTDDIDMKVTGGKDTVTVHIACA